MNEWVFDSGSIHKLNAFLKIEGNMTQFDEFEIDIAKIQWQKYSMNFGYGIKNYVLREEASLPSIGYNDVVQRMIGMGGRELLPWSKEGVMTGVRPTAEMRRIILSQPSV